MKDQAGFSAIEVLCALAVMVVLFLAESGFYSYVIGLTNKTSASARLDQETQFLTDYMAARLEAVGGASVRPWAAIWAEDNCGARGDLPNCDGSDRLTIAEVDPALAECDVLDFPSATQVHAATVSGTCCLSGSYLNKQIIVSKGDNYIQRYITAVDTGACTADIVPGQGSGGLDRPPGSLALWANSKLTSVKMTTFFLDRPAQELKTFVDANNDGLFDAGDVTSLADKMVDFQLSLGYDSNPRDGAITDNGSDTDEWLFNSNGPNELLGAGGLATAEPRDLRMVSIGLILGIQAKDATHTIDSVLNGPQRNVAFTQLRRSLSRFRLRTLDIFMAGG